MIDKLQELKEKSELMLVYSNKLNRITNDINAKAGKSFILIIYVSLFFALYTVLVARYFVFSHSSDYNLVQLLLSSFLVSLIISAIVIAILFIPITLFLNARRSKAFHKEKIEIEEILESIKELYISLNNYPAAILEYLNSFYLNKLIDYQKEEGFSIDEAIEKLEEEKSNNKKLQYSINAADKKINNMNRLFDLSLKESITETYQKWMREYAQK